MSEVKATVRTLADLLKTGMSIGENGQPQFEETAYADNLAEGLTMEQRKLWEKNDNQFMCAAALAFGEYSAEHMVKNKDVDQTNARIQMGGDKLDLSFKRKAEVSDGKGGRQEVHGLVGVKYRATAHLTGVKASLRATAAELLSK